MLGNKKQKEKIDKSYDKDISDQNYIIYDDNKKFTPRQEISAILSNQSLFELNQNEDAPQNQSKKELKVIVLIDHSSPIGVLNAKIAEELQKKPQFQTLLGFTVINIHKLSEKGEKTILPTEGIIRDIFKESGTIIYFDVVSNEYWIKCIFELSCQKTTQMIQIEYKFNINMSFKSLKTFLLKSGIHFFKENLNSNDKEQLTYLIQNVGFSLNSKHDLVNYTNEAKDSFYIRSLFDFEGQILCSISFGIFEKIIFKHIKTKNNFENKNKQYRWTLFKELSFEDLLSQEDFLAEKKAIQCISKALIKKELDMIQTNNNYNGNIVIGNNDDNEKERLNYYFYFSETSIINDNSNGLESLEDDKLSTEKIVFILPLDNKTKENNFPYSSSSKINEGQSLSQSRIIEDTLVEIDSTMKKKSINFKTFSESPLLPKNEGNDQLFPQRTQSIQELETSQNENNISFDKNNNGIHHKKNFLQKMRSMTNINLSKELVRLVEFKQLKDFFCTGYYKISLLKMEMETLKKHEYRGYALITHDDIKNRNERENESEPVVKINNTKILIFVMMALAFYVGAVVCIYYDYL